jgi:hypothetical protein
MTPPGWVEGTVRKKNKKQQAYEPRNSARAKLVRLPLRRSKSGDGLAAKVVTRLEQTGVANPEKVSEAGEGRRFAGGLRTAAIRA